MRVLLADDNASDRMILSAMLKREGYEVHAVCDGKEAVDAFAQVAPQLVLMDALMPGMDGREAARRIKNMAGDSFVPVVFLTSLSEAAELASCLEAGGDDFVSKPYNPILLRAKLNAYKRMRDLHAVMMQQRDQIAQANAHLMQEQLVAKAVFDNVAHSGALHADCFKHLLSPLAVFNGDVLLAARSASGGMHLLVGDFTGHGLPAAIGAMPLAEIFYGMTSKGFSIANIVREMNSRMKKILPVGVFCCASLIDVNFRRREFNIWHGGLPDAYLVRTNHQIETIPSTHLPLGVVGDGMFSTTTTRLSVDHGDHLMIFSDGIVEAVNASGDMYGTERLREVLDRSAENSCFAALLDDVERFVGTAERSDDLTLIEVEMMPEDRIDVEPMPDTRSAVPGPSDWKLAYELGPDSLKEFDPLPLLQSVIAGVPGLRLRSGELFTVLTEMFANALDHGVLDLSSRLKSEAGFEAYFNERARRLQQLESGFVRFEFEHQPTPCGGLLVIRVSDSGAGFDPEVAMSAAAGDLVSHGRGLGLIGSLCSDVRLHAGGRVIEADFVWGESESTEANAA